MVATTSTPARPNAPLPFFGDNRISKYVQNCYIITTIRLPPLLFVIIIITINYHLNFLSQRFYR